jgi:hypothetical protein
MDSQAPLPRRKGPLFGLRINRTHSHFYGSQGQTAGKRMPAICTKRLRHGARDLASTLGYRIQRQQLLSNRVLNGIEAMTGVANRARQRHIRFWMPRGGLVCVSAFDCGVGANA